MTKKKDIDAYLDSWDRVTKGGYEVLIFGCLDPSNPDILHGCEVGTSYALSWDTYNGRHRNDKLSDACDSNVYDLVKKKQTRTVYVGYNRNTKGYAIQMEPFTLDDGYSGWDPVGELEHNITEGLHLPYKIGALKL